MIGMIKLGAIDFAVTEDMDNEEFIRSALLNVERRLRMALEEQTQLRYNDTAPTV